MAKKTVVKEEPAHSEFGPSAAERYINCPPSVPLSRKVPKQGDTDYSIEGTRAHECLEAFLKNGPDKWGHTKAFLLRSYDREMIDHGLDAAREIWKILDKHPGAELYPEERVDISHFTRPGEKGTLDCAIVAEFDKLIVIDYKYGAGVFVTVEENLQLIAYALGKSREHGHNFCSVELYVIQPRLPDENGHTVRGWACTIDKLLSYEPLFRGAVEASEDPLTPFRAGKWCQFCPGKIVCNEVSTLAMEQARLDFAPEKGLLSAPLPESILLPDIATILPALDRIEAWIEAVRVHALHLLKTGHKIVGQKLVRKISTRKYLDEKKAKKEALKKFGTAALTDPELRSPAQLEKALKEDYGHEVVKKFLKRHVYSIAEGLTIAPEDDPRSAVDPIAESFPDEAPKLPEKVSKNKTASKKKGRKK